MAWGVEVVSFKDGSTVTLHFFEDTTKEVYDIDMQVPLNAAQTWLEDIAAQTIVGLSARTAVVSSIKQGPVTPTAEILGTVPVALPIVKDSPPLTDPAVLAEPQL